MTALWMLYAVLVAMLLGAAAALIDRTAPAVFHRRRWVWTLALAVSTAMPVWMGVAPRLGLPGPNPGIGETGARGGGTRPARPRSPSAMAELIARAEVESLGGMNGVLVGAWGATVFLAIAFYTAATWSLARQRRSWRATEIDGQAVLLAPSTGPAVVGALRPRIVVPEWSLDLPAEQRALMLEHERQHVTARDPLLLQVAVSIALLMPWNLGAWWLIRRLRLAVELDCDARVLARGHDSRAYGTLLLDVCARRLRPSVMLSPALFERTSSLTRRILAMHPDRSRFARVRAVFGTGAALAITALACDMPAPEVVAPDGKDHATQRLFGKGQANTVQNTEDVGAMVARYFPAVARGEGGPMILFVVETNDGAVVLTQAQRVAQLAALTEATAAERTQRERPRVELTQAERRQLELQQRERARALAKVQGAPFLLRTYPVDRSGATMMPKVVSGSMISVPTGIDALAPNDIEAIEVSKRAAGTVAPVAVSIVTIKLKPGANVPRAVVK